MGKPLFIYIHLPLLNEAGFVHLRKIRRKIRNFEKSQGKSRKIRKK